MTATLTADHFVHQATSKAQLKPLPAARQRHGRGPLALLLAVLITASASVDLLGQSRTATLTIDNIPVAGQMLVCSGLYTLGLTLPHGAVVTSTDVTYQIWSNSAPENVQSRIRCNTTGLREIGPLPSGYYNCNSLGSGASSCAVTTTYTRTGLTIANGVVPSNGQLNFRMEATSSSYFECGFDRYMIPNNTWSITVHYTWPACTGTPAPGNTTVSANPVCFNSTFQLGLQDSTYGAGVSYQWQRSTMFPAGPYSNVGPNNRSFTTSQDQMSWYRCRVTCNGMTGTSVAVQVNNRPNYDCYCPATHSAIGSYCITNVSFGGTLNNPSGCNTYTNYGGGPANTTGTFMQGHTYPFLMTVSHYNQRAVWIDFNQNMSFEASEYFTDDTNITIPYNALPGPTNMRVRLGSNSTTMGPDMACEHIYGGETEEYTITIAPFLCEPVPGNTVASTSSSCTGATLGLSVQFGTIGPEVLHQWQVSTVGANGPWTNFGTNTASITTSQSVASWYRAVVTCATGSVSGISTPVMVGVNPFYDCYCNTQLQTNAQPCISNVSFGTGLNNSSSNCVAPGYTNYAGGGSGTTGTYMKGVQYGLSTTLFFNPNFNSQLSIWIDHDRDGVFSPSEWYASQVSGSTGSVSITIPMTAAVGITGMRLRSTYEFNTVGGGDACTNYFFGETEDYLITIEEAVPCAGIPLANTIASLNEVCTYDPIALQVVQTPGTGLSYQWQSSTTGSGGPWIVVGSNTPFHSTTQIQTTWYRAMITCGTPNGGSAYTTPVQVTQKVHLDCYCSSMALYPGEQYIQFFQIGGVPYNSECSVAAPGPGSIPGRYSNYTTLPPLPAALGQVIPFIGWVDECDEAYEESITAIFIDWNQNGFLDDDGEQAYSGSYRFGEYQFSGWVSVPADAALGTTLMRVINSVQYPGITPCGDFSFGETEDYLINIVDPCADVVAATCPEDSTVCMDLPAFALSAGLPLNGTYTGNGVANGLFHPDVAGVGTHTITYTHSDGGQCSSNCLFTITVNATTTWYADTDGDGHGDTGSIIVTCDPPLGHVANGADCDDTNAAINPNATVTCDGIDNNCDGQVDAGCQLPVSVRVYLAGPYNTNTGLMSDDLRTLGMIPTTEPYTALGYSHTGSGGETMVPSVLAVTGHDAIVDWVLLELRSPVVPTTVLGSRCALVQRDGDVVDVDGISTVGFEVPAALYLLAVQHRNHLGCMTNVAFPLGFSGVQIDLGSNTAQLFGTQAQQIFTGAFPAQALWAGDVNGDGSLKYTGQYNDRDWLLVAIGGTVATNTITGYLLEDVNMDGVVKYTGQGNDRDRILMNIGGVVATNTREEQVP